MEYLGSFLGLVFFLLPLSTLSFKFHLYIDGLRIFISSLFLLFSAQDLNSPV